MSPPHIQIIDQNQQFIKECVEKHRMKLLDTSKRNNLISFNHSERSRQHVRVIDELPDFLFGQFLDGKTFTFSPLPEEDQTPPDEKSSSFRRQLEQAKLTDDEYRAAVDGVDQDKEGALDQIKKFERDLRNKVRKELGLTDWTDQRSLSNLEVAKKYGLNPSYEMPVPTPENQQDAERHTDKYIQTLLKPEEMARKLSGLSSYVRTDIEETGVNTLYAAFGFLQWYESENSEKACTAPLLLLQLEIEKKQSNEGYTYKIQATGEEPEINLSLSERMKKDFGFELPEFTAEDTPETFMKKVADGITPKKGKWSVRRFITIGRFRFSRLVMFHDLNPEKWPGDTEVATNEVVKKLFSGAEIIGGHDYSEDYHIDTPAVENAVPLLITAVDSSQHSAIVDVMKGNNLAIKGPPGTGKSQTITNIIACALAKGKTVLFLAEKMAALNVVYDRLSKAGLGPYCLELHSTKAKKSGVIKAIEERLNCRSNGNLSTLASKITEFKRHRDHITEYVDILNLSFGRQNKTVHDYLWAAQLRRQRTADLPNAVRMLSLQPDQANLTDNDLAAHTDDLRLIVELKKGVDKDNVDGSHPWNFVKNIDLNPFQQDELKSLIHEWVGQLKSLSAAAKQFGHNNNIRPCETIADLSDFLERTEAQAQWNTGDIDIKLMERIPSVAAAAAFVEFLDDVRSYKVAVDDITSVKDIQTHVNEFESIKSAVNVSQNIAVQHCTVAELQEIIKELEDKLDLFEINLENILEVGRIFGVDDSAGLGRVADLSEMSRYIRAVPREHLFHRTKEIINESSAGKLTAAYNIQKSSREAFQRLDVVCNLSLLTNPHEILKAAAIIEAAGLFRIFDPAYRKVKRDFKLACKNKAAFDRKKAAAIFREVAEVKTSIQQVDQDVQLKNICGSLFDGINTDFEKLININSWATSVRERFSGPSEFARNVRQWLLSADMDDLDSVRRLADDSGFVRFKNCLAEIKENISQNTPIREYLDELVRKKDQLTDLCIKLEKLVANGQQTFEDIAKVLPNLEMAKKFKSKAESNADIKILLSDYYKGAETNVRDFEKTGRFINDCLASKDINLLLEKCLTNGFGDNWKSYIQGRTELKKAHEKAAQVGQTIDDYGRIDLSAFSTHGLWKSMDFEKLDTILENALGIPEGLNRWVEFKSHIEKAKTDIKCDVVRAYLNEGIDFETIPSAFEYVVYGTMAQQIYNQYPKIRHYNGHGLEQARARLKQLNEQIITLQQEKLSRELNEAKPLDGVRTGRKSSWTEGPLIHNELSKQKRHIPIRDLMRRAGLTIQKIKPCFLMSPLTVAQYLQPGKITFDLVVIDEASQMRPEDALGGVARAKQIVVVGDPQQLPPTAFFQQSGASDDEEEDFISDAIMDMALSAFRPARILNRHYRSQHEGLIAFSNHHFYGGSLILFPSPVKNPDELGVRLVYVGGTYTANSNMDEVQAVVKSALDFMRRYPGRSLGIATMNQVQKDLIEAEMDRAFIDHTHAAKYKEKWQNSLDAFFVKNLESVQGDERDAIFISTVYGPDKNGIVMQRFGPINGAGGYRRLNVLFTRAKKNMVVFTSLKPEDIKVSDTSSEGLRAFKGFLNYAAKGVLDEGHGVVGVPDSDFEIWVKERLESIGCEVHPQVGVAGYRIDLGVKHPKYPYGYLLGIECDGATYHSSKSARERDIIRQQVLENLGWRLYRIWSTDWFTNPIQEFEKLKIFIEKLLESNKPHEITQNENTVENKTCPIEAAIQSNKFVEPATVEEKPIRQALAVQLFDNVIYRMIKEDGKEEKRAAQIVPTQGDPGMGTINQNSAIARALLGSEKGDEIEAILPIGEVTLVVQEIQKASSSTTYTSPAPDLYNERMNDQDLRQCLIKYAVDNIGENAKNPECGIIRPEMLNYWIEKKPTNNSAYIKDIPYSVRVSTDDDQKKHVVGILELIAKVTNNV